MENVQKSSHINKKILFILNWYVNKMFSSHCIPLAKAQNLTGNDTWWYSLSLCKWLFFLNNS